MTAFLDDETEVYRSDNIPLIGVLPSSKSTRLVVTNSKQILVFRKSKEEWQAQLSNECTAIHIHEEKILCAFADLVVVYSKSGDQLNVFETGFTEKIIGLDLSLNSERQETILVAGTEIVNFFIDGKDTGYVLIPSGVVCITSSKESLGILFAVACKDASILIFKGERILFKYFCNHIPTCMCFMEIGIPNLFNSDDSPVKNSLLIGSNKSLSVFTIGDQLTLQQEVTMISDPSQNLEISSPIIGIKPLGSSGPFVIATEDGKIAVIRIDKTWNFLLVGFRSINQSIEGMAIAPNTDLTDLQVYISTFSGSVLKLSSRSSQKKLVNPVGEGNIEAVSKEDTRYAEIHALQEEISILMSQGAKQVKAAPVKVECKLLRPGSGIPEERDSLGILISIAGGDSDDYTTLIGFTSDLQFLRADTSLTVTKIHSDLIGIRGKLKRFTCVFRSPQILKQFQPIEISVHSGSSGKTISVPLPMFPWLIREPGNFSIPKWNLEAEGKPGDLMECVSALVGENQGKLQFRCLISGNFLDIKIQPNSLTLASDSKLIIDTCHDFLRTRLKTNTPVPKSVVQVPQPATSPSLYEGTLEEKLGIVVDEPDEPVTLEKIKMWKSLKQFDPEEWKACYPVQDAILRDWDARTGS